MEDLEELDDLIQGSTPEEKLKSAKEIIQTLEKEVFKLRAELKRTENSMKKLQESTSTNSLNSNNTSSAFLLPSEFKKNWEILVMENILDLFQPFLSSQVDFVLLVQLLTKTVLSRVTQELNAKLDQVQLMLGATTDQQKLRKYMMKLFQDHFLTAFPCNSSQLATEFLDQLPKILVTRVKPLLESPEFSSYVSTMHKLSIHMLLNDPVLELKFTMKPDYITVTKSDDFYYIDGFPVGTAKGIIVLPSVTRNSQVYTGIKPAVLILPNDYQDEPAETENRAKTECLSLHKSSQSDNKYTEELEPYPPLQRKREDFLRKDCLLCKIKSPCAYCSKMTLLALAKRVPAGSNQRFISRVQSNSFIETPNKNSARNMTSCLSRRLSEAAKKIDKKSFIKNKHLDKEACKVM